MTTARSVHNDLGVRPLYLFDLKHTKRHIAPAVRSAVAAQDIYNCPEQTPKLQQELFNQLRNHYMRTGMWHNDHQRAYGLALRGLLRACRAPIVHEVERRLLRRITAWQAASKPLAPEHYRNDVARDYIFSHYASHEAEENRSYKKHELAFLRASKMHVTEVGAAFVGDILSDTNHWCRPLYNEFQRIVPRAILEGFVHTLRPHAAPYTCFIENLIAANVTVMNTLTPAARHDTTLSRPDELSWPASTNAAFFEDHFPDQALDDPTPKVCPFEHDERLIAQHGVWNIRSLKGGPWEPASLCPANIPLVSPWDPLSRPVTAAELRLQSVIPIARETLFAG